MPLTLKNLLSLTNEKLALAIKAVREASPEFKAEVDTSDSADCFATLLELINPEKKLNEMRFGGLILSKLLDSDDLPWGAIKSTRIFLRYKVKQAYVPDLLQGLERNLFEEYSEELLLMLIKSGMDINLPGIFKGGTLLHDAAFGQSSHVIAILLKVGANPHCVDGWNDKPIHTLLQRDVKDKSISAAHLFLAMLDQFTLQHVVDLLFTVNMEKQFREDVCRELVKLDGGARFCFYSFDLLHAVNEHYNSLLHLDIQVSIRIGEGSNGDVYACRASFSPDPIALKQPKEEFEGKRIIEDEMTVLSQFDHPHVIKMIDKMIRNETLCFLMPYAQLGSLQDYIRAETQAHLSNCFYSFSLQLNDGLRYVHGTGFGHFDFKASNILLYPGEGELPMLKVADFGAARKLGFISASALTAEWYRSPELSEANAPYTIQNDIFSLGIIMGFIITKVEAWRYHTLPFEAYQEEKQKQQVTLTMWCAAPTPEKRPTHEQIEEHVTLRLK
jgi:hypothetical protein